MMGGGLELCQETAFYICKCVALMNAFLNEYSTTSLTVQYVESYLNLKLKFLFAEYVSIS